MSHYASDSDNTNGRCWIVLTGGPGGARRSVAYFGKDTAHTPIKGGVEPEGEVGRREDTVGEVLKCEFVLKVAVESRFSR